MLTCFIGSGRQQTVHVDYLQQSVQPVHVIAVGLEGTGEEHDEVLDLEHEGGVSAVGRVGPQGRHDLGSGPTPHLQGTARDVKRSVFSV